MQQKAPHLDPSEKRRRRTQERKRYDKLQTTLVLHMAGTHTSSHGKPPAVHIRAKDAVKSRSRPQKHFRPTYLEPAPELVWMTLEEAMRFSMYCVSTSFSLLSFEFSSFTRFTLPDSSEEIGDFRETPLDVRP